MEKHSHSARSISSSTIGTDSCAGASSPRSESPDTLKAAGSDRFTTAYHRTQRDRDALHDDMLVAITLPAKEIAQSVLRTMRSLRRPTVDAASTGFDVRIFERIETFAEAVLHLQRRTEQDGPAALPVMYRRAVAWRDRIAAELAPLMKSRLLDPSTLADVTSERGYALVARELLLLVQRVNADRRIVEAHTTLGADTVVEAHDVAMQLFALHRRHEQIDQDVHGARIELRRALTLLLREYSEANESLGFVERITGIPMPSLPPLSIGRALVTSTANGPASAPPSTSPVPTPPPARGVVVTYKDVDDPDTIRTPRVANDNEADSVMWKMSA